MEPFEYLRQQITDLRFTNNLDCLSLRLLMLNSYGELIQKYTRSRKEDVALLLTTGREMHWLYQRFTETIDRGMKLKEAFETTQARAIACLDCLISIKDRQQSRAA